MLHILPVNTSPLLHEVQFWFCKDMCQCNNKGQTFASYTIIHKFTSELRIKNFSVLSNQSQKPIVLLMSCQNLSAFATFKGEPGNSLPILTSSCGIICYVSIVYYGFQPQKLTWSRGMTKSTWISSEIIQDLNQPSLGPLKKKIKTCMNFKSNYCRLSKANLKSLKDIF